MSTVPQKLRKTKCNRNELLDMNKNDLVEKIIQLEAHNTQLKNIIAKTFNKDHVVKKDIGRKFNFEKCHFRRVLLKIMYLGWDYHGLAVQEDSTKTIEHYLFYALIKSCLIQSRETSDYHRCGRTDKGVSAFGQVISISLRSKYSIEAQYKPQALSSEIEYCKILNRLLPKGIRAVAWLPIPEDMKDYSARFDCVRRQYKYYFPRSSLLVDQMKEACSHLIGAHDFRHLCKMDVGNGVVEFLRQIFTAEIVAVDSNDQDSTLSMFYLQIEGKAFLWHQIRCIMGVLLLIGQGLEEPSIIQELLDIKKNPRKPQYSMASDLPLNLFECSYDIENTQPWIYEKEELEMVIKHLQAEWTMYNVKSTMIKDCLKPLEAEYKDIINKSKTETMIKKTDSIHVENETGITNKEESERDNVTDKNERDIPLDGSREQNNESEMDISKESSCERDRITVLETETNIAVEGVCERDTITSYADCLLQGVKAKIYKPLLKRDVCSSLEERIEYYRKRRKINTEDSDTTVE